MRGVGFVVAMVWMLGGHGADAASPQWSVTPPSGWTDASSEALQRPQNQAQHNVIASTGGGMEIGEYHGAPGNVLVVVFVHMPSKADDGSSVEGFEKGAHDSVAKLGSDKSYTRQEDTTTLDVDEVVAGPNGDVHLRRLAGATGSELRGLAGTCMAPEAVCAAALRSMTIDRSGFVPLHGHSRSSAYQLGRQVGRIGAIIAMLLVALWFLRRSRRKQEAPISRITN